MPGGIREWEDAGDERDQRDAIPTSSRRQRPTTEHESFDLGTSDVDGYDCEDADDADAHAHEMKESWQADDGTTQNVEN